MAANSFSRLALWSSRMAANSFSRLALWSSRMAANSFSRLALWSSRMAADFGRLAMDFFLNFSAVQNRYKHNPFPLFNIIS